MISALVVDEGRMAANLAAAAGIEAEQQAMADLVPAERSEESLGAAEPSNESLGAAEPIIDRVLARAGQRPGVA